MPWLYRLPGGLLLMNILSCTLFAAVSGSSAATTATVGRITLAEFDKLGYDRRLAMGSLAGAGTLGFLIPPSLIMIVYAILAEVSIGKMFIAGILPGLLLSGVYSALHHLPRSSKSRDRPAHPGPLHLGRSPGGLERPGPHPHSDSDGAGQHLRRRCHPHRGGRPGRTGSHRVCLFEPAHEPENHVRLPHGGRQNQRHDHDDRGGGRFSLAGDGLSGHPGGHHSRPSPR